MTNKIFIYLFFFALLFIFFQYMNEKKIFESQEARIIKLEENIIIGKDSLENLQTQVRDLNYFSLLGNENAMTYLENLGYEGAAVEAMVSDQIYELNLTKGNNPLVPFEGMDGSLKINKLKFLNHKWILADFSDGTYWGEMILEFSFNQNKEIELTPIASLLYPN